MFEMCGNGRPGSNASGVRTGKTWSRSSSSSASRWAGVELGVVDDVDAGLVQLRQEVAEALARSFHDFPGTLLREGQQLLRRVAVR